LRKKKTTQKLIFKLSNNVVNNQGTNVRLKLLSRRLKKPFVFFKNKRNIFSLAGKVEKSSAFSQKSLLITSTPLRVSKLFNEKSKRLRLSLFF